MEINQLKERIEKKKNQIEKLNKKIAKWESRKNEKDFLKDISSYIVADIKTTKDLVDWRANFDLSNNAEDWVEYRYGEYIKKCDDEIKRAKRDLEDAQITLAKYTSQLLVQEDKNNTEKVQIIMDFLQNWKKDMIHYIENDVEENVKKFYEYNHQYCEMHNNRWRLVPEQMTEDEFQIKLKELYRLENIHKQAAHPISFDVYHRGEIDYEKLNQILDKDVEAKYWNMEAKVTRITGKITDASQLYIGHDGNINGIIIGENGKARLETIYAGGYNQDIIVNVKRGQCLHFRLLVHKIN